MPDLYHYCSLILFLYYHSLLQFFIAYSLSTDSLFVTSKIHITSTFINPGLQAIIQAQYVGTNISVTLHTSGFHDSLVIAMKTKPRKMLLYIPQNTVLTEVAYFSKVNYLASYLDLNLGGTTGASTSPVHKSSRTLLQIIGN